MKVFIAASAGFQLHTLFEGNYGELYVHSQPIIGWKVSQKVDEEVAEAFKLPPDVEPIVLDPTEDAINWVAEGIGYPDGRVFWDNALGTYDSLAEWLKDARKSS